MTTSTSEPDVVEAEPEFDRLGLPLEPGARVAEVLKRQAAAAAEAEKAADITAEAERMRAVVEQLVDLGWTVTPPAAR